MKEKVIYVKRGQKLTMESLLDVVTGDGFFLVTDEDGNSVVAREIATAEGVRFTTDASKQQILKNTLQSDLYLYIKDLVNGSREDVRRGPLGEWREVDHILYKDLAKGFNRYQGKDEYSGLSARMVGIVCRDHLQLFVARTGEGWVVVLDEQTMRSIDQRVEKVNYGEDK